jgi:capsular polysaccharide biosynthesis protein
MTSERPTAKARRSRTVALVVVLGIIGAIGGFVVASMTPAVFRSTSTLLVGDLTNVHTVSKENLDAASQVAATYGLLARTEPVLGPAAEALGGDVSWQTLADRVHVNVVNANALMTITTTGTTAEEAMRTGRAVIKSLQAMTPSSDASVGEFAQQRITELTASLQNLETHIASLRQQRENAPTLERKNAIQATIDRNIQREATWQQSLLAMSNLASSAASPNTVNVLQDPTLPSGRSRPNVKADVVIGAALGVIAGMALLIFWRGAAATGSSDRRAGASGRATDARDGRAAASGVNDPDPWVAELSEPSTR